jgi:hypothetical protein
MKPHPQLKSISSPSLHFLSWTPQHRQVVTSDNFILILDSHCSSSAHGSAQRCKHKPKSLTCIDHILEVYTQQCLPWLLCPALHSTSLSFCQIISKTILASEMHNSRQHPTSKCQQSGYFFLANCFFNQF